ncbi:MAG: NAD(+)/NADH kinase [Eubacterium sp.]|nr:NAD(+)/NADH kinase [Eubacterium sp.]
MKNFLIVTNPDKDENLTVTNKIKDYIASKGGSVFLMERGAGSKDLGEINLEEIKQKTDCVMVLGGDGTMIRAARDMTGHNVPIFGVNLGTLGYLCEVESERAFDAIDRIFDGDYVIEERMMIVGQAEVDGWTYHPHNALNDIVVYRAGSLQVVSLDVYVNGKFLCNYFSDGLIIATPTGSTAYNMSTGGPIVDPKAELILITPINAQAMSARTVVLGASDEIEIVVKNRNNKKEEECCEIAFDGDNIARLKVGERIRIKKSDEYSRFLKLSKLSFIERLQKKMNDYR